MSYADFWPHYLAGHSDPRSRALHYLGTLAAIAALALALWTWDWRCAVAVPVLGYGPAWIGHAAFEQNRPETFSHPAWSLFSDLRMLALFLTGRIGGELRRAGIARG